MTRISGRLPRIALVLAATAGVAACHKDSAKPADKTSAGTQASGRADDEAPHRNVGPGPLGGRRTAPPPRQGPPEDRRGGAWSDRRAEFDTDGDGQLSADEHAAMKDAMQAEREQRRADMMAKFDKDADGQISDEERTAMRAERVQGMVTHLDTDQDGKVSQAELEADHGGRRRPIDFAAADTDHDGALTAAELQAVMPDRGGRGGFREHDRDAPPDDPDAPPSPPTP
jgi:hypothetical protein